MHDTTALVTATLSACLIIAGWLVTYALNARAARLALIRKAALDHLSEQLEKLYGPLAFLIIEGQRAYQDLTELMGRQPIFRTPDAALPDDELATWLFWVENSFLPRQEAIKNLLLTHTHLIVGAEIPDSYKRFLDHHNSWRLQHLRWQKDGTSYLFHSKIDWPKTFNSDVLNTFKRLKSLQEELLQAQMSKWYRIVRKHD